MKVLLIGGGGREHAIARELVKSDLVDELLCAPGNAGIAGLAKTFPNIKATDLKAIVELAHAQNVDFVVVAPDDPLAMGLVDMLEAAGIPAFGPTSAAARIESSKVYSKSLMKKHGIPTAMFETFNDVDEAIAYIERMGAPIVVKADGLALGKGVIVADTLDKARNAVRDMMLDKRFGESGTRVVIEEYMSGPETTQLVFCDGKTYRLMPSSLDHKRAFDGDEGPNTGGMGALAPSPWLTPELSQRVETEIIAPTVHMLCEEGVPFKGVLYVGLMLTHDGPKVIEYNARFGDPEAQVVLPLLRSDLMKVFIACREGSLDMTDIKWSGDCAACIVIASGGYPQSYSTGYRVMGLDAATECGAYVYHAGTKSGDGESGNVLTAGGRVLGVTATAQSLAEAVELAYLASGRLSFENMYYRRDIGRG